jgi:hypothetical protein
VPIRGLEGLDATVKAKAWPVGIGMDLMAEPREKDEEAPPVGSTPHKVKRTSDY